MSEEILQDKPIKKKNKSIIVTIVIILIGLILFSVFMSVFLLYYSFPKYLLSYKSIDDLVDKEYTFDETYSHISNINYEDYLEDASYNEDKVVKISNKGITNTTSPVENKNIVESAIEELGEKGGTIVIDVSFVSLPIELKSNITLIIEKDCFIESVGYSHSLYYEVEFSIEKDGPALLYAKDAENIKIYGPGKLVGNGTTYTNEALNDSPLMPLDEFNVKDRVLEARKRLREARTSNRPNLMYFENCSDLKIKNLVYYEAANWTCKIIDSDNVKIEDCIIDNHIHVANADGFDIVSSQKVEIDHCFISTADDGICIKANGSEEVDKVEVNRCTILSMANCFKIGTETSKDIENIKVYNCYFFMPEIVGGYAGIAIESADGSNISDVVIDHIYMEGISSPLLIWLGNRLDANKGSNGEMGSIKNISVTNIEAIDVELASAITGCVVDQKEYRVEGVRLANFDVTYRDTKESLNVGPSDYELSMNGYPEITRVLHFYMNSHDNSVYYDMPVYGLFCRHVYGITVLDFNVTPRKCNTLKMNNITDKEDIYDVEKILIR